jgi:hypothetical protein
MNGGCRSFDNLGCLIVLQLCSGALFSVSLFWCGESFCRGFRVEDRHALRISGQRKEEQGFGLTALTLRISWTPTLY